MILPSANSIHRINTPEINDTQRLLNGFCMLELLDTGLYHRNVTKLMGQFK
jgi:hypothetical protein